MRAYDDIIDVRTAPTGEFASGSQFLWRGRLYVVRSVLAQWIELGRWWTSQHVASGTSQHVRALTEPESRSISQAVGAVEREVWRVEAAWGAHAGLGVYDLAHEIRAHGHTHPYQWRLARALD